MVRGAPRPPPAAACWGGIAAWLRAQILTSCAAAGTKPGRRKDLDAKVLPSGRRRNARGVRTRYERNPEPSFFFLFLWDFERIHYSVHRDPSLHATMFGSALQLAIMLKKRMVTVRDGTELLLRRQATVDVGTSPILFATFLFLFLGGLQRVFFISVTAPLPWRKLPPDTRGLAD